MKKAFGQFIIQLMHTT